MGPLGDCFFFKLRPFTCSQISLGLGVLKSFLCVRLQKGLLFGFSVGPVFSAIKAFGELLFIFLGFLIQIQKKHI